MTLFVRLYRNLMLMVSINSGWNYYTVGAISYILIYVVKASGGRNAFFMSFTNLGWYLKPIFGFLSDTFYIFGFR